MSGFASASVTEHVARGAVGLGALGASLLAAPAHPWLSLLGLPVALIALRGCPTCWTIGLVQTIAAKLRGKPADDACRDGACGRPRSSGS